MQNVYPNRKYPSALLCVKKTLNEESDKKVISITICTTFTLLISIYITIKCMKVIYNIIYYYLGTLIFSHNFNKG